MITYKDAKDIIESIYGEVQGYKAFSWAPTGSESAVSIGKNYVFIGYVYLSTPKDYANSVSIGIYDNRYITIFHDATTYNAFSKTFVIGTDNKDISDYFIDGAGLNFIYGLNVTGWLFQVNK